MKKTTNIFIYFVTVPPYASPFFAVTLNPFTLVSSIRDSFLSTQHPASLPFSLFFFCLTAFHHPPLPPSRSFSTLCLYLFFFSRFPLLGVFAHNHSALITLMALMIHLNGALSPSVSLQGPFLAALLDRSTFSVGTMTVWHLLLGRVTPYHYIQARAR